MKKINSVICGLLGVLAAGSVNAAETVVDDDKTTGLALSIYNNNLALVRDAREVSFGVGNNLLAFAGVAREMKPETVRIASNGISVVEQNYDYNVINQVNLANESVGKTVKTALFNEQTGQTIYDKAKIIDGNYGNPILQFDYGVETNFPGRIIYEEIPNHLRAKPTLAASIDSIDAGAKTVELAYLTGGMSWKADYIADVKDENVMDLQGWITLNNNSGAEFKDALVQLVAGNVNVEYAREYAPMAPRMMKAEALMAGGYAMDMAAPMPSNEALGDYYLYTLPAKITIKDKQSKQVSLLSQVDVRFIKDYRLYSPLYVGFGMMESEFKKDNPDIIFKLTNVKEDNLGLPLPKGVVRFYEKDSKGNAQFLGESSIEQLAVNEKAELKLGRAFDVFAKGKVKAVRKIAEKVSEADVGVTFNNSKDKPVKVEFLQRFGSNWTMLSESIKSEKENSATAKWVVEIPANGTADLTFKVRSRID